MTLENQLNFSDLALPQEILKAVNLIGFTQSTPVQAETIPPLLEGRDVLATAQTGSGKTAAFGLPLLATVDPELRVPQMLVMAPTRELAIQVAGALQDFSQFIKGLKTVILCGGQPYPPQIRDLKSGAQIIVGTPGRLLDHINKGTLKLDNIKSFVLDEADDMLKMGFIEDVETVMEKLPEDHQTALFSATMPAPIKRITKRYMKSPVEVEVRRNKDSEPDIEQLVWYAQNQHHKNEALFRFLEVEDYDGVIIFTATKAATEMLAEMLLKQGLKAAALNGDMEQRSREKTLERMRAGSLDILVATDVAARGIDIERISLVINYDITDDENYIHRIGRTGRAGRSGRAILFVTRGKDRNRLRNIERMTKKQLVEIQMPDHNVLMATRRKRFKKEVDLKLEHHSLDKYRDLLNELFSEDIDRSELSAAMLMLLQKDKKLILSADPVIKRDVRERNNRGEKRGRNGRENQNNGEPMNMFRIEVGRNDGVEVKHIVGAIANEGNISSQFIGHIKLNNDYSTVELPAGLPNQVVAHFTHKARVLNKPMQMSLIGASEGGNKRGGGFKRKDNERKSFRNKDRFEKRGNDRSGRKSFKERKFK